MNLLNCFEAYNIESIHIKYNPSGFGLSWLPVLTSELLNDDAWENTNDAICDFIGQHDLSEGTEFLAGVITPDYDENLVALSASQTRSLVIHDKMPRLVRETA